MTAPQKTCSTCGESFSKQSKWSRAQWAERRFCSVACSAKSKVLPIPSKVCAHCGITFEKNRGLGLKQWHAQLYCSRACRNKAGAKGLPYQGQNGYLYRSNPGHPEAFSNGDVPVHREVWYDAKGDIPAGHHIHHVNGDRLDNRLENLRLISAADHARLHWDERRAA